MNSHKTILITGASRGIGRATALALAGPGVRLVLAARSAAALEEVAAACHAQGAEAVVVPCDATAEPHVRRLAESAAGATGRVDLLVHSVGNAIVAPLEELTLARWEESLRTLLTSTFLVVRHIAPLMGQGGLIAAVLSVAARQTFPNWSAYCAAKHGALGFLGAVREEFRPRGIRVTAILPAATDTDLWDSVPGQWNRANMLQPAEVAQVIAQIAAQPTHLTVEEISVGHVVGRL
jgi:3-oxoacyl-[acyl-carrier protein] reductase